MDGYQTRRDRLQDMHIVDDIKLDETGYRADILWIDTLDATSYKIHMSRIDIKLN